MFAVSVGVGNNEDSPSKMVRTDGRRRYAFPFEAVPEIGQVGGNISESVSKEPWHVLHDRPVGSNSAKASRELGPQPSMVQLGELAAGDTDGLAWESAANKVGSLNGAPVDLGHVAQVGHIGPVLRENPATVRIDLGLPHDPHSGPLEP
jgi:hypothetical protein